MTSKIDVKNPISFWSKSEIEYGNNFFGKKLFLDINSSRTYRKELWQHCQNSLAKVLKIIFSESEKIYETNCSRKVLFVKVFLWTQGTQFWQFPREQFVKSQKNYAQSTKLEKFSKHLFFHELFFWTRNFGFDNRAKNYLPEVRESYREKLRNISNDILLQQTGFKRLLWTRRLQFWQPFFEIFTESPWNLTQSTIMTKNFFEKICFRSKCSTGCVNTKLATVPKIICQKSENPSVRNRETFQKTSYSKKQSSKSHAGRVDCTFGNPAKSFPQKLENCSLRIREKWKKWQHS